MVITTHLSTKAMASLLRLWFFIYLVLLSVRVSETRIITRNNVGTLIERAREILEVSTQKHDMVELKQRYNTNRLSPGGPDPKHH